MSQVPQIPESHAEALRALRAWATAVGELNRHLGVWLGLPKNDAAAFSEIVWAAEAGEPLSPTALARRIALTSGATTALLHRLERAGFIARARDDPDGRRVTLRPTPSGRESLKAFVADSGPEIQEVMLAERPETMREATRFITALTRAGHLANERLRANARQTDGLVR